MQISLKRKQQELFNIEIGHSGTGFGRRQYLGRNVQNKITKVKIAKGHCVFVLLLLVLLMSPSSVNTHLNLFPSPTKDAVSA